MPIRLRRQACSVLLDPDFVPSGRVCSGPAQGGTADVRPDELGRTRAWFSESALGLLRPGLRV